MKNALMRVAIVPLITFVVGSCGSGESPRGDRKTDPGAIATMQSGISTERLTNHVRYLASDELEGRAPGSRGEELTLTYLVDQYRQMGYAPGNPDGTYLQEVPLVGTTVLNSPSLELKAKNASASLRYKDDFMGWTLRQEKRASLKDADVVFVGYGIVAPEYGWDDFKGVDVANKVIVMLVGDPPLADTTMFGGKAMTYYGRWTYKFEIAAEKNAAGAIIVHNTAAAGYPWEVVSNSWSGEQFDVVRPNKGMDRCVLESWVTEAAAEKLLEMGGLALGKAYEEALSKEFRPVPLGVKATVVIENSSRNLRSYNVVARLEGRSPKLKEEYVIYTAHWDHLGKGNPVDGDSIYNGALDNATGVAGTLEIARAFAAQKDQLKRSILFLNTTAEESGLLGAKQYVADPLFPLERTIATMNLDGLNVWGPTKDVVVVGFGFSDLDGYLEEALDAQGRFIKPDAEPEKGYYYRSDHFEFAKMGVPSLYADGGVEYVGRPKDWGLQVKQKYTTERYHKPKDELDGTWDLGGAVQDLEALFRVGMMLATSNDFPEWAEKSEFRQIREASLKASR